MVALVQVPVCMTVGDFLNWDSGELLTHELVHGEPRATAPTNRTRGMSLAR